MKILCLDEEVNAQRNNLKSGVEAGVRYGAAVSALKQTNPGDLCWATREEVERILDGANLRIAR